MPITANPNLDGSPIRTLYFGLENVRGVLAATRQNMYMEVGSAPNAQDMFQRELIRVHNGTAVGSVLKALGPRHSELTLTNLPLFDDQTGWFLAALCGLPTDAAVSGTTTSLRDFTFKLGPTAAPPTASIQFYNGVRWRQMTGAVVTTAKISGGKEKSPRLDISFMSNSAINLTAPTVLISRRGANSITAAPIAVLTSGVITSITTTNALGGTVYNFAPQVYVLNAPGDTTGAGGVVTCQINTAGAITAYTIVSGGSGYTSPPILAVIGGGGPGVDAVGTAVVASGVVTSIANTFAGLGYNTAPILYLYDGNGSGATATATVSGGGIASYSVTAGGTGYTGAPPAIAISSAYDPVSFRHLSGTIGVGNTNASPVLSDIISYDLEFNNNRVGLWTGRASADVRRFRRGLADNKLTSTFDFVQYTGSAKEQFDLENDLGYWRADYVNTGVAPAAADQPGFQINVPNVIIEDTSEPDDGPEVAQQISGQGAYATSPATSATLVLRNNRASGYYALS